MSNRDRSISDDSDKLVRRKNYVEHTEGKFKTRYNNNTNSFKNAKNKYTLTKPHLTSIFGSLRKTKLIIPSNGI